MVLKKKKTEQEIKKDEYEQIGRQIVSLYDSVNPKKGALYKSALIKGILGGVGGVLGATLVIALLLWILSLLNNVPLVGDFFEAVSRTIENTGPNE